MKPTDTFRIKPYKGVGKISKNLNSNNVKDKTLLGNLPQVLRGYGKTLKNNPYTKVLVICDLDDKCLSGFRKDLLSLLNNCNPKPGAKFCIAVEEGEAWLLGDKQAIFKAYPKAKKRVINSYNNDSICGTWELLADAVHKGGVKKLKEKGWKAVGREKSVWAERRTPHIDVQGNSSPSFVYFKRTIEEMISNKN